MKAHTFTLKRKVEFPETDMAGIVHFANFFRYMEAAEHAFYRELGFSVALPGSEPPQGLPRVHATCNYRKPLRFEEDFEVQLIVREVRSKTLKYQFLITKETNGGREEIATGSIVVVCVQKTAEGGLRSASLPDWVAANIEVAPAELWLDPPGKAP